MDYDFRRLDLRDESDAAREQVRGWLHALRRAFREPRHDDALEKVWLEQAVADEMVVTGAWLPEGAFGAGPVPVATFTTFDKTINLGRDIVPARLVTDVTTSPAHRRRGLLRRLMEDTLTAAVADGMPLAALTASEATIYGRWGFGVATMRRMVELDTRPGFALRHFADSGRVEMVDPRTSWPTIKAVFDRFHQHTRGSVELPQFYEPLLTGAHDFESGEDKSLMAAVHLDADESVDGFVVYKPQEKDKVASTRIFRLIGLDSTAQLGLWSFLAGIDLADRVTTGMLHPQDPLEWALRDINRLKTTGLEEFLWLRVLDVRRVLEARPWSADGELVVEVEDNQNHAAGRWTVTSRGGAAEVLPTDRAAQVRMDVETLGTLTLGPVGVEVLRGAGRIRGEDRAVRLLAAMADLPAAPYNATAF